MALAPSTKTKRWVLGKAKSDPYVDVRTLPPQLKAAVVPVRTRHVVQTLCPTWDEALVLSVRAKDFETLKQ